MGWVFRGLFTSSVLAAGVALFFFFWGLVDGTVSETNGGLWAGLLAVFLGIPAAGWFLHAAGHRWTALAVLLVTALPALAYALFIFALLVFQPRWN